MDGRLIALVARALPFRAACLALLACPVAFALALRRRGHWNVWLSAWLVLFTGLCAYCVWPGKPTVWIPRVCSCMGVALVLGLHAVFLRRMESFPAWTLASVLSLLQWPLVFATIRVLRQPCRLAAPGCGCG